MKHVSGWTKLASRPRRHTSAIIILIIAIGIIDAAFVAVSNDLRTRSYLLGRANTVAASVSPEDIKGLQGNQSDLTKEAHGRIKQRLGQIKGENEDIRFIYLMGKRDGSVFFYADSEDPSARDYSPPGQIFNDASERLQQSFSTGNTFTEGPVRDKWGIWISALAPVIDPRTNEIVAMAGIDIPAQAYYSQIALIAVVPLLLAAIPVAGLLRDRKLERKEWEIANLKSQFVSIASHELRSPLSGMLWAIQSLLDKKVTNLTDQQRILLKDMYRSTESSVATINEILDLSIFERGKTIKHENEVVDLASIIRTVMTTLRLGAQEKNLDVIMAKTWPEIANTRGDVAILKRAFMNILSNAIKYSPAASTVTVTYRQENHQHIIGFLDQGIGIPEAEQRKVFEGYYRAGNATKMQAHGTGLGLFISRLIIEEHKGKVWLESKENRGTTVFISLPVASNEDTSPKTTSPAPLEHQA